MKLGRHIYYLTCLLYLLFCLQPVTSQSLPFQLYNKDIQGAVYTGMSFYSKLAGEYLKYSVYLPPNYSQSGKHFPVLYLLHGIGGNENSWIKNYAVHRKADSLIVTSEIPPLIIVMPDGRRSYYINDYQHKFPYESIFIYEFIPFVDSVYKTIGNKQGRVIGGFSMGGYGALVHCMKHPDIFSGAVALSAAVRTDSMVYHEKPEKYHQYLNPVFGDSIQQYGSLTRHWIENNPLYIIRTNPDTLKSIQWYLSCGLSDYLLPGNEALHDLFMRYKIPHEFNLQCGGHEWAYWEKAIIPALLFTGRILKSE
jgi:enterochelin esterase-like enzyme